MRRLTLALSALAIALWAAGTATATTYPGVKPKPLFKTPAGAAYCYIDATNMDDMGPSLKCWTPNDGFITGISRTATKPWNAYYDTYPEVVHGLTKLEGYSPAARTIRFGTAVKIGCSDVTSFGTCGLNRGKVVFVCRSERSGLTCTNNRGRGYWIGRYRGYEVR